MTLSRNQFKKEMKPLAKKLLEYIKSEGQNYGVTDAKIVCKVNSEKDTELLNGGFIVSSGQSVSIGIRLFAGKRSLSFSVNTPDEKALKNKIDDNFKIIGFAPETESNTLADPDVVFQGKPPSLKLYDDTEPTADQIHDYLTKMDQSARAVSGIKTTQMTRFSEEKSHQLVMDSRGVDLLYSKSSFVPVIAAVAEDKSGRQSDYEYAQTRFFDDLPEAEEIGLKAADSAMMKLSAETPKTGSMPVVFSRDASAVIYKALFSGLDAAGVIEGTSPFKDKLGQQVANDNITIVDAPNVKKGLGSQPVDSTGQRAKKIEFIKNGVLQEFAMSAAEAKKLDKAPIARNDGLTNTSILPGKMSVEDLISDIDEGIYVDAHQGGTVDIVKDSFSKPASGRWIRNGKITDEPVDGFIMAGKLSEMFMNAKLANDTPSHPNTKTAFACPTTRIDGLKIAGA
ncbi:MAG: hypothetical protein CMH28_09770 [Micavibrio sp.]|nr:hypothetical protein [Micavibrio sp.]